MKWVLLTPAVVLLLLVMLALAAFYTGLYTEPGARWVLSQADKALPGSVRASRLQGSLADGLVLENVIFEDESTVVRIQRLELEAGVHLSPLTFRVRELLVTNTRIDVQAERQSATGGLDPEQLLKNLELPVAVEFAHVQLDSIELNLGDRKTEYRIDSLLVSGGIRDELSIDRLELVLPGARLVMGGQLGLNEPYPLAADLDGELIETLESGLDLAEFQASLHGSLKDYQLVSSVVLAAEPLGLASTAFAVQGEGSWEQFRIHSLAAEEQWLEFDASGDVHWSDALRVSLAVELVRLDPGAWLSMWPAADYLQGAFELNMDEVGLLDLHQLQIETAGGTSSLAASGQIDLMQGKVEGQLVWQELAWPINALSPEFYSSNGSVILTGKPDEWQINGSLNLQSGKFPEGRLTIRGAGDRNCGRLHSLEGDLLGGHVAGKLDYCWSGNREFTATLSASQLVTDSVIPEWPGTVDLELESSGRTEPLEISVDLKRLAGTLRDFPVHAMGGVELSGKNLRLDGFQLSSGASKLELSGDLLQPEGLSFLADIDSLDSLLPGSTGSIDARGQLSLYPEQPRLALELVAEGLSYQDVRVDQLEIMNAAESEIPVIADMHLTARDLRVGTESLDHASLDLLVQRESQQLRLSVSHSDLVLTAGLLGALDNDQLLEEFDVEQWSSLAWSGELEQFALSAGERLTIGMTQPASMFLSRDKSSIRSACLTAGETSSMCLDADWTSAGTISSQIELRDIPLRAVEPFLDTGLKFNQQLTGNIEWDLDAEGRPSGGASIILSKGEIRFAEESESLLETGEGAISFMLNRGHLTKGEVDIPLPGIGLIDLDLEIQDVTEAGDSEIAGRAYVTLDDLGFIPYLVDGVDAVEGRLQADLSVGGHVRQPLMGGSIHLADGSLDNHVMGLALSQIQLAGNFTSAEQATLKGSFEANEGKGMLSASLDFADLSDPRVELALSGDQLTLLNEEELMLTVIPDLTMAWQSGMLHLDGRLEIPAARVVPRFIPGNSVRESPDRVIVAGQIPGLQEDDESDKGVAISGDVDIILGDKVELDLGMAVVKLGGDANFAWQHEMMPVANGNITLLGQIQAYGQSLRITDGLIGWSNAPADNPQLNIRAERQIYGNSEVRRAGVFVSGTPRRLVIEPFTDPLTNRERARTLLVTGSDFNMEKGVGAVDVGTYIAPRLFLSYGIGVFEDDNVISIRYDLGRNWGVKATSGQRGTGLDISYTIEH